VRGWNLGWSLSQAKIMRCANPPQKTLIERCFKLKSSLVAVKIKCASQMEPLVFLFDRVRCAIFFFDVHNTCRSYAEIGGWLWSRGKSRAGTTSVDCQVN
jgi:hypothetical protein